MQLLKSVRVSPRNLGKRFRLTAKNHARGGDEPSFAGAESHAQEAVPLTEAIPNAALAPRRSRILIIEDNQEAADSLALLLRCYGYEVLVAYTGPAGLESALAWVPDVVLSDIGLPGLNGWEIARTLRHNPSTAAVRLLAISGFNRESDRQASLDAGFEAHLAKPVAPDALQEMLLQ
jgi:CheY-like chemotaxis protein